MNASTKAERVERIPDALAALKRVGVVTGYSITGNVGLRWRLTHPGDIEPTTMTNNQIIYWIEGALAGLQATGYAIDTDFKEPANEH